MVIEEQNRNEFDLARFVEAQANVYEQALAEVSNGRKQSHWMWYIFPQLRGLGQSAASEYYGIADADEARAYLTHDLLGPRLKEICAAALSVDQRSASDIFGSIDDKKLHSCATLFAYVSAGDSVFHRMLDRFFGGKQDRRTIQLLAKPGNV